MGLKLRIIANNQNLFSSLFPPERTHTHTHTKLKHVLSHLMSLQCSESKGVQETALPFSWFPEGGSSLNTKGQVHSTHLGFLSLGSDQCVLVVLGHLCKDALKFGRRNLQGLQSLLGVTFIQGFIN